MSETLGWCSCGEPIKDLPWRCPRCEEPFTKAHDFAGKNTLISHRTLIATLMNDRDDLRKQLEAAEQRLKKKEYGLNLMTNSARKYRDEMVTRGEQIEQLEAQLDGLRGAAEEWLEILKMPFRMHTISLETEVNMTSEEQDKCVKRWLDAELRLKQALEGGDG